jgi:hypothetical protein
LVVVVIVAVLFDIATQSAFPDIKSRKGFFLVEARDKGCQRGGSERMTGSSRALRERLIDNDSSLTEARNNERWSEEADGDFKPDQRRPAFD